MHILFLQTLYGTLAAQRAATHLEDKLDSYLPPRSEIYRTNAHRDELITIGKRRLELIRHNNAEDYFAWPDATAGKSAV